MPKRNSGPRLQWFADRGAYYITWTEHGRSRKRSTYTADSKEAQAELAKEIQRRGERISQSNPAEILITDVLNDYALERGPKVIGGETLANCITNLAGLFDGKTVAEIPRLVDGYIKKRNRSAGTVRRELGVLQAAINHAHKRGKLTYSVSVELPPVPPSKERYLTRQEAAKLLRATRFDAKARLYMPLFILISVYTGRRKEAVLSLRWSQVDLERNLIDFRKPGEVETKKRRGRVPIPPKLIPHLRRARLRGSDLGPVLHISGRPIQNIKKGFAAACRRADIEGATPHTLRHTAATWLMQKGVSLTMASEYLSMTEATLRRVYWHHHPDYMREAAEAIGRR
jgi:integrase